ncbi:MAG: hypothetical protein ACOCYU_03485 [Brevefilum sp.]
MNIIISIIRILTAIVAPVTAIVLCVLTLLKTRQDQGHQPDEGQACLRCGQERQGAEGQFHYTESIGNARERAARKQLAPQDTPILGSENHFICDHCAQRFVRNEIFQILLMLLPYPLYLYVITPLFAENGIFSNFLIETLLVVLSVAGATAAFDLYRAVGVGRAPLTEARDRVAINHRKKTLGKKFSYYTRMGTTQLQK